MNNDKGFDIRVDMRENAVLINGMRKWLQSRKIIDRAGKDDSTYKYISSFRIYTAWIILKQIFWKKSLKIL